MKQIVIILIFFIHSSGYPQSGTIRVAKPKVVPKKDTAVAINYPRIWSYKPFITSNYSFKKNNQAGYEAGISINHSVNKSLAGAWFGLSYSTEHQYFEISSYNKFNQEKTVPYSPSQNKLEYIKLPIGIGEMLTFCGGRGNANLYFEIGIIPKYLLKTKNEYDRLNYSDFRKYNISGKVSFGFFVKRKLLFEMIYSYDFFENLKDRNIYDKNGAYTGKQHSKTKLLSLSVSYVF